MEILVVSAVIIVIAIVAVAAIVILSQRSDEATGRQLSSPPAPGARVAPKRRDLRTRLGKTRHAIGIRISSLVQRGKLDDEFWGDLEETLIAADVGLPSTNALISAVQDLDPSTPDEAMTYLCEQLILLFDRDDRALALDASPAVVLVVGVNGGGKTTSIAKLAAMLERQGTTVVLGAADTYRAAADQQLRTWADRIGIPMVGGAAGADSASVAFDAYTSAHARGAGAVVIDTAGRLTNQENLMAELTKVAAVLRREAGSIDEVLLVIDGSTGQNAVAQARRFIDSVGVTGLIITKLVGTPRGGVAVAVDHELNVPVKFIGVGESLDDLITFDPEEFVDALLGE